MAAAWNPADSSLQGGPVGDVTAHVIRDGAFDFVRHRVGEGRDRMTAFDDEVDDFRRERVGVVRKQARGAR